MRFSAIRRGRRPAGWRSDPIRSPPVPSVIQSSALRRTNRPDSPEIATFRPKIALLADSDLDSAGFRPRNRPDRPGTVPAPQKGVELAGNPAILHAVSEQPGVTCRRTWRNGCGIGAERSLRVKKVRPGYIPGGRPWPWPIGVPGCVGTAIGGASMPQPASRIGSQSGFVVISSGWVAKRVLFVPVGASSGGGPGWQRGPKRACERQSFVERASV